MSLWVKQNQQFESDDTLEAFILNNEGIIYIFDQCWRYTYRDIPKFLIYSMAMFK